MSQRFIGYMFRPKSENEYTTVADEQYCRELSFYIFGTSKLYKDTAFCETHALWWILLCILIPSLRDSSTEMLEIWDLRE